MNLEDLKIKDSDISEYGVVAAPDRLTGTAQENKKVFDRLIRACVGEKFNILIDFLADREESGICSLPIASADTLGGIRIGEGLSIDANGVVSVTAAVAEALPDGDEVSY